MQNFFVTKATGGFVVQLDNGQATIVVPNEVKLVKLIKALLEGDKPAPIQLEVPQQVRV